MRLNPINIVQPKFGCVADSALTVIMVFTLKLLRDLRWSSCLSEFRSFLMLGHVPSAMSTLEYR